MNRVKLSKGEIEVKTCLDENYQNKCSYTGLPKSNCKQIEVAPTNVIWAKIQPNPQEVFYFHN